MSLTRTRVRYGDTDQGGVAYHANYLRWFEDGRTELLRELGFPYSRFEQERGLLLTVIEAHLKYEAPARYDDALEVITTVTEVRRVRLKLETVMRREGETRTLCQGSIWLACVDREGRPRALPPDLLDALAKGVAAGGKMSEALVVKPGTLD